MVRITFFSIEVLVFILILIVNIRCDKETRDNEVCISMLTKFMNFVPKHKQGDKSELEKHLHNYCKEVEFKEPKEHRLCGYIGVLENSLSRIVNEIVNPLSRFIPPKVVCENLKKVDAQISTLRYEKKLDLGDVNLNKLRVNELMKILLSWNEENACRGCVEKSEIIKAVEELMPKHDPDAHRRRQAKSEL